MKVSILSATENPIDIISLAAGTSYDKDNESFARVRGCVKRRHTSVLEHAVVTFRIDGISRACSHQLVRHRLASFVQQSQRYVKLDTTNDDWYVIPPSIANGPNSVKRAYRMMMNQLSTLYNGVIKTKDSGIKAEDIRYVLPNACKTNITMTMNAREFYGFLNLRKSPRAQWEIRELAELMEKTAADYSEQWGQLMSLYEETKDIIN